LVKTNRFETIMGIATSNINLMNFLDDFLCYFQIGAGNFAIDNSNFFPQGSTLGKTSIAVVIGTNDFDVTLTWQLDDVDSTKVLTVPPEAGAANYNQNDLLQVEIEQRLNCQIEGNATDTGQLTLRNFVGVVKY